MDFNTLDNNKINQIADAIKQIENSKKYPYGIKSINTHGDESMARKICINTIKNDFKRWNHNKSINFLDFLADRYCPPSVDKQGNFNWKKNIHKLIK